MKKYLSLAAFALLFTGCSEKPGYEITGTVSDASANGKQVYLYNYALRSADKEAMPTDSALIENGTFTFKGTTAAPQLQQLVVPTEDGSIKAATFVLENAKMTAVLGQTSVVAGTPENDLYNSLNNELKQLDAQINKLSSEMKSADAAIASAAEKKYEELEKAVTAKAKAFIEANTDKLTAAVTFFNMRYNLSEEEQNAILDKASADFKAVPGIDRMIDHLAVLKNTAVGKKFIDFEMADANGKMHKLSEYVGTGKVVLIDFWASWCPPCRREMPNLVKAYKDYKGKGFEIVGISLDSKPDAWAKGVKDLGITWPQLSDLQGWKNSGAALYGVNSIPHTVLVDKEGTIIAKNLHGDELDAKLKEVLK